MRKVHLLSLIIIMHSVHSFSQFPFVKAWDYRYGGLGNDKLESFQQTRDGGYVLGGNSVSGISGDKSQPSNGGSDFWIVKTNETGIKLWDKCFGGSLDDELHALKQTADGGYILGGFSKSGISGDKTEANWDSVSATPSNDYWIVKIDSLGNKQWDKRFGGIWDDQLYSLVQTTDGGYLLGGYSSSGISGDKSQTSWGSTDYWIIKTDSLGNKLWDRRFGGVNNEQLYAVVQSSDGGFLLGGFSWSPIGGDKTQANCGPVNYCDFWIVKTDASGNKQWDKRYGGSENDMLRSIAETRGGGFLLGGYSWSGISGDKTQGNFGIPATSDFWILRIDAYGNIMWDKTFGGVAREDEYGMAAQTLDGGFLIGGTSYSGMSGNKTESNMGSEQTWIVKTDASGNIQWDKTILTPGHDESGLVIQTRDGNYTVANHTNAGIGGFKSQLNRDLSNVTYDYWLLRFVDNVSLPHADFVSDTRSVCSESCISFSNLSLNGNNFQWIFEGAIPSISMDAEPHNICYNQPGTFDVTLIASNGQGTDTLILQDYIAVLPPLPQISVTQSQDTLFTQPGFTTYQWYFNQVAINGAIDYFIVTGQNGIYHVFVTDTNGCSTSGKFVNMTTGMNESGIWNMSLEVYPNPAERDFSIVFISPKTSFAKFELLNSSGQIVFKSELKIKSGENEILIADHSFPGGIYSLRISEGNHVLTNRIVILGTH